MQVSDFDYYLPEELIAQHPISDRDHSRMLVYHRQNKSIEHRKFYNIIEYLNPGDCLVINDTRVIPARIFGRRKDTGAKVEILLLENKGEDRWETLVRPGRKAKVGSRLLFDNTPLEAKVIDILENGSRIIEFKYSGIFKEIIEKIGAMPLPPYIHERLLEKERYQTIYSKYSGSSAAPTAGLHFTANLLNDIEKRGIKIARITLHVGLGTFRPVKTENILEHKMHSEAYFVSQPAADTINQCVSQGGRLIAVGTTTARTIESMVDDDGVIHSGQGRTDIFIYPGYNFKGIDGLITNFHLPKSTLIMLVAALIGREEVLKAYEEAVEQSYRFFSFGDAMLIL